MSPPRSIPFVGDFFHHRMFAITYHILLFLIENTKCRNQKTWPFPQQRSDIILKIRRHGLLRSEEGMIILKIRSLGIAKEGSRSRNFQSRALPSFLSSNITGTLVCFCSRRIFYPGSKQSINGISHTTTQSTQ